MPVVGFRKGETVYGANTGRPYTVVSSYQAMLAHGVFEARVWVDTADGRRILLRASSLSPLSNLNTPGVAESMLRQLADDTLKED